MNQQRMLGNTTVRCCYGCCRATPQSGRKEERRWAKRSERNKWRNNLSQGSA